MWFYANGGQQLGPVDDAGLEELARQGVIRPDTLVWREGMPAWQPYQSLRAPAPMAYAPPPPYSPAVQPGPYFDFALWPTRALGALIDWLAVFAMMAVLYAIGFAIFGSMIGLGSLGARNFDDFGGIACCCLLGLTPVATILVGLYNKMYLVATRGFSIGQGIMKLKVVDARGNRLSMGQAFIRLLVQAGLSLIWFASVLDYLWPLWDVRRQTLHDKAVDCFVINNPSGQ